MLEAGVGVGVAGVAGVVQVQADRRRAAPPPAAAAGHEAADLGRDADADRVGEHDLVRAGRRHAARVLDARRRGRRGPRTGSRTQRPASPWRAAPAACAARDDRSAAAAASSRARVLVALGERVGDRIGDVHLAHAGGQRPLQRRARFSTSAAIRSPSPPSAQRREDLLRAGHLRHELRVDEARRLDPPQAGGGEPVGTARRASPGASATRVVLQAVARPDVADDDVSHRATPARRRAPRTSP